MTREEAVVVLKTLMKNPLFSEVHKVAFNIAIHDIKQRHDWDINNLILINKDNYEPLEQEPTTKNDLAVDCVSRKAVLDAIDSKAWEFCDYLISKGRNDEQKPVSHFADNLRECVREDLPSVTPQPKTGHWIEHEHNGIAHIECSECSSWFLRPHLIRNRYCPNCGAKMAEKEG